MNSSRPLIQMESFSIQQTVWKPQNEKPFHKKMEGGWAWFKIEINKNHKFVQSKQSPSLRTCYS